MKFSAGVLSFSTAVGNGVVSAAKDLAKGVDRVGETVGIDGRKRSAAVLTENKLLAKHLSDILKAPISINGPISRSVTHIVLSYYEQLPDEVFDKLAAQAVVVAGRSVGRNMIAKRLAQRATSKLVARIVSTAVFRELLKKIGVSAGVAASGIGTAGVGTAIGGLMTYGVAQRASEASQRLRRNNPRLYHRLRNDGGLDMIYFIVEEPMNEFIVSINRAQRSPSAFLNECKKLIR